MDIQNIDIPLLTKQRDSLIEAQTEYQNIIDLLSECGCGDVKLVERVDHFDGIVNLIDSIVDTVECKNEY